MATNPATRRLQLLGDPFHQAFVASTDDVCESCWTDSTPWTVAMSFLLPHSRSAATAGGEYIHFHFCGGAGCKAVISDCACKRRGWRGGGGGTGWGWSVIWVILAERVGWRRCTYGWATNADRDIFCSSTFSRKKRKKLSQLSQTCQMEMFVLLKCFRKTFCGLCFFKPFSFPSTKYQWKIPTVATSRLKTMPQSSGLIIISSPAAHVA